MSIKIQVWDCATKNDVTTDFVRADWASEANRYAEVVYPGTEDTWWWEKEFVDATKHPCGTYGKGTWKGVAQYYDTYVAAAYPNDPWHMGWALGDADEPWRGFLGTASWVSHQDPSGNGAKRQLDIQWNCCKEKAKTTYSYLSISTTDFTP